jgi:hypothetical protein
MTDPVVLWKRLDHPGHDSCRLTRSGGGWKLEGAAVFEDERGPAHLAYEVWCDGEWRAQGGHVSGWLGSLPIDTTFSRAKDAWHAKGRAVPGLEDCLDLDFAFTPATNFFQLRRLNLAPGQAADAPSAWFDPGSADLVLLPQRYERRSESAYWYEAPTVGYAAELRVTPQGFVSSYPGLWELVEAPPVAVL